jgi:hypothetical protein
MNGYPLLQILIQDGWRQAGGFYECCDFLNYGRDNPYILEMLQDYLRKMFITDRNFFYFGEFFFLLCGWGDPKPWSWRMSDRRNGVPRSLSRHP